MNRAAVNVEGIELPFPPGKAASFAGAVLEKLEKHNWELSILFCGDEYIRSLNKRYRGKDEATDVLSFTLGETKGKRYTAGDIVISLDMVKTNAEYFGVPAGEELRRLIIHGILHLSGMDHASNDAEEPMLVLQEKILRDL